MQDAVVAVETNQRMRGRRGRLQESVALASKGCILRGGSGTQPFLTPSYSPLSGNKKAIDE
jgi:hypothetical protein